MQGTRNGTAHFSGIPARNVRLDWSHEKIAHGPRLRVILKNGGSVLPKTVKDMKTGEKEAEQVCKNMTTKFNMYSWIRS